MTHEFELPDVGEGVAEGEIVNWLVEPGDTVEEDQPVAEVETDKAVVDVPSPVDGTVAERRAEAGEMVPVGDVFIVFDTDGDGDGDGTAAETEPETEAEPESVTDTDAEGTDRVFAAPSARRLARERGVDISAVEGADPSGRITAADVRAHTEETQAETSDSVESAVQPVDESEAVTATTAASTSERADRERTLAVPATRKLAAEEGVDIDAVPTDEQRDGEPFVAAEQIEAYTERQQAAQAADARALQPGGQEKRVPYQGIRRTIGQQMERSKFTAPHVTHHDEVDVTELVETRDDLKQDAEERGVSLTYMPFVMKAVVAALQDHPYLNASLDESAEEIVLKHYYNVGVAVATDAGLMVPVIDDVDRKGLLQLSSEMNELVTKARDREITREEMQGGTFTITNFGAVGGEYATPIINHPESAILGLGEIKEKPRVIDGEIVPRKVMTLSLSIDHRVIDGAVAGAFTNTVKQYLNNPTRLLL
ncbi:dihydrolipoamide acetyltransferase family protein [Halocatena pleomorpha]|uniref:2-oxo acid dehydrogenase subunit E2 n=1 Tax=Halocatena pleomorpha TaxID=1785090 RepID=A0A3P3R4C0_9EURY|nr:dihydrolipoamide acetyltransferase family protein [Halocatena pleomorpha]RRJ28336.1 2-oxo acid dehydrogenase subunit E2 [Halocatena pleomorpha]